MALQIDRHGAYLNRGTRTIKILEPNFHWDPYSGKLYISAHGVKDFSGDSLHSYHIYIDAKEIGKIISTISNSALEKPHIFHEQFSEASIPLIRMSAIAVGLRIDSGK